MLALLPSGRWGWCALVAIVAGALYLPGLDSFGFWDPYELDIADQASGGAVSGAAPFTAWMVRQGFGIAGNNELAGRLPLALLGIAVAVLTFVWVRAAAGSRAAVLAALLVIGSPLMVVQSRQLTSSIGLAFGHLAVLTGASAAIWTRRAATLAIGIIVALLGAVCAYFAGGALLGVAVPVAALLAGCLSARRYRIAAVIGLTTVAILVLIGVDAAPFGRVRAAPRHELTWGPVLEQIAFGTFPWVALVPAGVVHCLAARDPRRAFAAYAACAWAALGLIGCATIEPSAARVCFPAVAGLAFVVAVWLDDLVSSRHRATTGAVVLAGLFVALFGRDLMEFPERMATLHIIGPTPAHANSVGWLNMAPVVVALAVTVCLVLAVTLRGLPRRIAAAGLITASVTFGSVVGFAWIPTIARNQSNMLLFDRYRAAHRPGEVLTVMARAQRGAAHYVPDHLRARNPADVVELFAGEHRAFALIPQTSLCEISQAARAGGRSVVVIDDSDAFALVSNLYRDGDPRSVGLDEAIRSSPPTPATPMRAIFNDELELIGIEMPPTVKRGDSFSITLYYRVLARPKRAWTVFLHFDHRGVRFQGDHPPVGDRCPTNQWNPGDYIVDTHRVSAGDITHPKGRYDVWTGLFFGGNGVWTNMKASADRVDDADRVYLGAIDVR